MRNLENKRTHPVSIMFHLTKYFWVLLIPLLRTVLRLGFDVIGAFRGAYLDVILMSLLLAKATLSWYYTEFETEENLTIKIKKGIFIKRFYEIPFSNVSTLIMSKNLLHAVFATVKLSVFTSAKPFGKPTVKLYLRRRQAETIKNAADSGRILAKKSPNWYSVLLYSFLSSSGLAGILFLAAMISGFGIILGRQLNDEIFQNIDTISKSIALGIPPVAIGLGIVIFAGWLASFMMNVGSLTRFSAEKKDKLLKIDCGIFKHSKILLNREKITFIDSRKTLLSMLMKCGAMHVGCIGYGTGKNSVNLLYPNARNTNSRLAVLQLDNSLYPVKTTLCSPKKSFRRFIFLPCIFLGIALLLIVGAELIGLNGIFIFFLEMLPFPLMWWLLVRIICFFKNGIGSAKNRITVRYVRRLVFHKLTFNTADLGFVVVKTNPFQRRKGFCDVKFKIVSARKSGAGGINVRNLSEDEAKMEVLRFLK